MYFDHIHKPFSPNFSQNPTNMCPSNIMPYFLKPFSPINAAPVSVTMHYRMENKPGTTPLNKTDSSSLNS